MGAVGPRTVNTDHACSEEGHSDDQGAATDNSRGPGACFSITASSHAPEMNVGSSKPHADPPLPIMAAGGSLRRMIHVTHTQAATIINIRKREVDRRPAEGAVSGYLGRVSSQDGSAFISLASMQHQQLFCARRDTRPSLKS